jgi:hypothetical protein
LQPIAATALLTMQLRLTSTCLFTFTCFVFLWPAGPLLFTVNLFQGVAEAGRKATGGSVLICLLSDQRRCPARSATVQPNDTMIPYYDDTVSLLQPAAG